LVGESDTVNYRIQPFFGTQRLGEFGQIFIPRDVALKYARRAERCAQFFHRLL